MKIALIQMLISNNKSINLKNARKKIESAASKGANIICLPEMFNCPYNNKLFNEFSETDNGQTVSFLKEMAMTHQVYIIGGSIPEKVKNLLFNTSYIISPEGQIIEKHRKAHLFDVDIKDGITFKESEVLSAGNKSTVVKTDFGTIGIAICYDMRFPEFIRSMVKKGAEVVFIPAAFNMTTGPAHWHTIAKSRALDNQIYMLLCSPARDETSSYVAYGHSLVANPWGQVVKELDEKEGILFHTIDFNLIRETRESLPLLKHLREEIY